jgi:hypothetical protein
LVVNLELAPAAAAHSDPLQQRLPFADRAARLVRAQTSVASDAVVIGLERRLVNEAGVVIPDQDPQVCLRDATHPLTRVPVLVDIPLPAGLAERARAGVDRALEHAVDLVIGRHWVSP